jgi:putative SOS response-associated peptidase YedK
MCGRYSVNIGRKRFEHVYGVQAPLEFVERFNLAPTELAPIIRRNSSSLESAMLHWGFKSPGKPVLGNARVETVANLSTFASSFGTRRLIAAAGGWFEWKRHADGSKEPHYLRGVDGEPLAFAGLWTPAPTGEQFTILTTAATPDLAHIHDRQPVILSKERWKIWLSDSPLEELEAMLRENDAPALEAYPVSARVSKVGNDDADIVRRVPKQQDLLSDWAGTP